MHHANFKKKKNSQNMEQKFKKEQISTVCLWETDSYTLSHTLRPSALARSDEPKWRSERFISKSDLCYLWILNSTRLYICTEHQTSWRGVESSSLSKAICPTVTKQCAVIHITEQFVVKNTCQIFQLILIWLQNNCQWLLWYFSLVN